MRDKYDLGFDDNCIAEFQTQINDSKLICLNFDSLGLDFSKANQEDALDSWHKVSFNVPLFNQSQSICSI